MHTHKTMNLSTPCCKATSRMSLLSVVVIANTVVQLMHHLWGFLLLFFGNRYVHGKTKGKVDVFESSRGSG